MITTLILETRSIIHITVRFEEHHYSYLILHYLKLYYQVSFKNIKRISIARQYIFTSIYISGPLRLRRTLSRESVHTNVIFESCEYLVLSR